MSTWCNSGLEMMADHEPCTGACAVCELFGELTPERLAWIARQYRGDEEPVNGDAAAA